MHHAMHLSCQQVFAKEQCLTNWEGWGIMYVCELLTASRHSPRGASFGQGTNVEPDSVPAGPNDE